jgi:hypothetical protein
MTPKVVAPIIKKIAHSGLFRYSPSRRELMKAASKASGIDCYDYEVAEDKYPQLLHHMDDSIHFEMRMWKPGEGPTVEQYTRARVIGRLLRVLDRMRINLARKK